MRVSDLGRGELACARGLPCASARWGCWLDSNPLFGFCNNCCLLCFIVVAELTACLFKVLGWGWGRVVWKPPAGCRDEIKRKKKVAYAPCAVVETSCRSFLEKRCCKERGLNHLLDHVHSASLGRNLFLSVFDIELFPPVAYVCVCNVAFCV